VEALDLAIGTVDLGMGQLRLQDGRHRELTPQECALLEYLARRPHVDVSREELLTEVLDYAPGVATRAIDDAMKRLRAKVERVPSRPFHLVAVRGIGYRFVPLEEAPSARRFALGERMVDLDRLVVEAEGEAPVTLSDHEGRLLEVLHARRGRPIPTLDLLRQVWGIHDPGQRRVVDKLVYRLRAKVEEGRSQRFLRTIRGRGLALVVEGTAPVRSVTPGVPCPPPDGPVVGRDPLVDDVLAAIHDPGSLVTLHGPAGAGKSTVARAVAARWSGHVGYADLEPHRTEAAIRSALARAVGADAAPEESPGRLHDALRIMDDVLVVLDHAEVALDPLGTVLRSIRAAAGKPRFLVTSRHPLAVPGEHIVTVEPLARDAAIELFVARAAAAGVALDPSDDRLHTVVEEVDRIPLALDLAAGRLRLLGLEGLVARLDRPLQLLQDARTHDGLRQSIARTWEALTDVDRTLLAACSQLPGAFSPDAAEHVCRAVTDEGPEMLDSLQRLVDFALLKRAPDGRLVPFLGVSEYVAEALRDELTALAPRVRAGHLEWLASLGELSEPFWGPDPVHVARLAAEIPSAVAVLADPQPVPPPIHARIVVWLAPVLTLKGQSRQARALLRRVGAPDLDPELHAHLELARFRGATGEGPDALDEIVQRLVAHARAHGQSEIETIARSEWIRQAVDAGRSDLDAQLALLDERMADLPTPVAEAHACAARGWVWFRRGDLDRAWSELQEALTLARLAPSPWLVSRTCYNLAGVCRFEGRLAEAEAFLEQSRGPFEEARIPYRTHDPDDMLGLIRVEQGRFAEARALHEGILQRSRQTGQRMISALQANRLGTIAGSLNDTEAAMRWFEEARRGFLSLGEHARAVGAAYNLGEIALQSGRLDDAETNFQGALAGFREMGREVHAGMSLGGLGRVALARGEPDTAEPMLTEALAAMEAGRARRQAAELRSCLAQARTTRDPAGAVALARQAVDALQGLGPTPTLGAAWCRYGLASLAAGDPATATEALARAEALVEQLPMASGGELGSLVRELSERLPR